MQSGHEIRLSDKGRQPKAEPQQEERQVAQKGDRIELVLPRVGVRPRGTVYYVDDLQILVKWDDGRSESLRPKVADHFRFVEDD